MVVIRAIRQHLPAVITAAAALPLLALLIVNEDGAPEALPPPRPSSVEKPRDPPGRGMLGVVVSSHTVDVAARADGLLTRVLVRVGGTVASGELLAELDSTQLQLELRRADAALTIARAEQRRASSKQQDVVERLERRRALSASTAKEELRSLEIEAELQQADVAAAAGKVAQAEAERERLGRAALDYQVRAPFAGRVSARYVDPGAWLARGAPIVTLLGDERWVRFAAPPDTAKRLGPGGRVGVRDPAGKAPPCDATVVGIAPDVDGATDLVFVEAKLEQAAPQLEPGVPVRVFVAGEP